MSGFRSEGTAVYLGLIALLSAYGATPYREHLTRETGEDVGYSLIYSIQQAEHENNTLSIDENGNVTVQIQRAETGDSPRSLGWYYFSPGHDDTDLRRIGTCIRENTLVGESHSMTPFPGMRGKSVTIKFDEIQTAHLLNLFAPVPEQFVELEGLVEQLFRRAEGSPVRTFGMDLSLSPEKIRPGEELRIEFVFRNSGNSPTLVRNPAAFNFGGVDALRINLWRDVRQDSGEIETEYESTLELEGRELLIAERESLRSDEPYARIPEGGELRVWTTIQLPGMDPGTYLAEAVYYGHPATIEEQQQNPDLLVGEFHAELFTLIVEKPLPKPER